MYRDLRQRELEKAMHATGPDKAAKREHYARNAFEYGELMKARIGSKNRKQR